MDDSVKKKFLASIGIAENCPASWNLMSGDDKMRFCHKCNLNVYNLSAMSELEAENFMQLNSDKPLCVRFYRRLDGKVMTKDCPLGTRSVDTAKRWGRFLVQCVAAVIAVVAAGAAGQSIKNMPGMLNTAISQSFSQATSQLGRRTRLLDAGVKSQK